MQSEIGNKEEDTSADQSNTVIKTCSGLKGAVVSKLPSENRIDKTPKLNHIVKWIESIQEGLEILENKFDKLVEELEKDKVKE